MKKEKKRIQPVEEVNNTEYLNKKKEDLDIQLKKKVEEQKDLAQMVESMMEQKEELKKVTQKVSEQMEKIQKLMDENEEHIKALDHEISEKKADKAQGYLKLRKIMTDGNFKVKKEIQEQQKQQLNTQKLLHSTETVLNKMTEWKKKTESDMEQCKKELEDIQRQSDNSENI